MKSKNLMILFSRDITIYIDDEKRERDRKNPILMADTDGHIWRDAFEKNFSEQTLINNVVKEIANSISRNIGWMALEYILYGGENVLTK